MALLLGNSRSLTVAVLISLSAFAWQCHSLSADPEPTKSASEGSPVAKDGQASNSESASSVEVSWITIPAGKFFMGAQKEDPKKPNYEAVVHYYQVPVHEVHLREFRIARYEVTVAEYKRFVDAGGYAKQEHWKAGGFGLWQQPLNWEGQLPNANFPVTGVNWYEASAYAAWAGCRLPTEAEWERAARGLNARKWPWESGEDPNPQLLNSFESEIRHPTAVGTYPRGATPEGVFDMAGNAWEWCADVWHDSYRGAPSDGSAWKTDGDPNGRVIRGGAWNLGTMICRSSGRGRCEHDLRDWAVGFRLVAGGT